MGLMQIMDRPTGEKLGHKELIILMGMLKFLNSLINQRCTPNLKEQNLKVILGNMIQMLYKQEKVLMLPKNPPTDFWNLKTLLFIKEKTGFLNIMKCTQMI